MLVPRVAAMLAVSLALRRRWLPLASLAVSLVIVRRSRRPGLGSRSISGATLCCRLHWRLAGPGGRTLFTAMTSVVMVGTFPFPRPRPVAFALTVIPVIPVAVLPVAAAVAVPAGGALAAARRAVVRAAVAVAGPGPPRPLAAAVRLRLHSVQRVLQR